MVGDRCVPSRRRKAGRVGTVSRECRWQHFLGVDQRSLPPGPLFPWEARSSLWLQKRHGPG